MVTDQGQHILVTGAAGSIGSQLCSRIAELEPASLSMLDQNETELLETRNQIGERNFPINLHLGSVTDRQFVERVFAGSDFTTVIHAAAYKHLDSGEAFPWSMVSNNIQGTHNVAQAADNAGVARFMLISTDKSVEPSSVMGATKLWCEHLISTFGSNRRDRNYASVRFGNVIESRGSVVPKFKKQIQDGGPVTVSDWKMKRYFMSTDEAVDLILQAIPLSTGGETFVLKMGEPVAIIDIARALVHLSGKTLKTKQNPNGEIALVKSGRNEAEKFEEKLFGEGEEFSETEHPSILVSKTGDICDNELDGMYVEIEQALQENTEEEIRSMLFDQLDRMRAGKAGIDLTRAAN